MHNKITNKTNTFLIHDYETFGKSPTLDRPSQFSSIRTNYHFHPIEQAKTFFCRLPNDYLPDPEAVLLTEIDPIYSLNTGLKEYQFAQKIQKIFNTPQTCILGYNNIHFDNMFSRNIFYRNFYDPYNWSWKDENSTWDLLHITRAFYVLRPEGIKWPLNKKGFPSFRLQDLAKSNNIPHNKKHDALSDVYATLGLAKLLKKTNQKLFNYLYHYRTKKELKKLINTNIQNLFLYIPTNTTPQNNNKYVTWVTPLSWHPNNLNILITYNLNINIEKLWIANLKKFNHQNIKNIYHQNQKTIFEFIQLIYINKCPILIPKNHLHPEDISKLDIKYQYYLDNFKKLKYYMSNNDLIQKIIKKIINSYNHHYNTITKLKISHVDNQLYNGFFNQTDQCTINMIRNTIQTHHKQKNVNFTDERLKSLYFYYRARNFPNTLNQDEKNSWLQYRKILFTKKILLHYKKQLHYLSNFYKNNNKKLKLLNSLIKYSKYISTI